MFTCSILEPLVDRIAEPNLGDNWLLGEFLLEKYSILSCIFLCTLRLNLNFSLSNSFLLWFIYQIMRYKRHFNAVCFALYLYTIYTNPLFKLYTIFNHSNLLDDRGITFHILCVIILNWTIVLLIFVCICICKRLPVFQIFNDNYLTASLSNNNLTIITYICFLILINTNK